MPTIDFPSSVNFAVLCTYNSKVDAALVSLIKGAHGIQFGKKTYLNTLKVTDLDTIQMA